ncbi:GNAT family N-acetyltransferase, partial [Rhizobium ruizarguesonis]
MRDLANFKGCPAPNPVTLKGRFVTVEPYRCAEHLEALWDGLGGMGINPLLLYFAQDDFSGIDDFANWLETVYTKSGWLTHIFRD